MQNNLKERKNKIPNYIIDQKGENLALPEKDVELQKGGIQQATKRVGFINLLLFKLGFINFLILTYFYTQENMSFSATGWLNNWLPLLAKIHWYQIFLGLIALRMMIVFVTHQLTQYITTMSRWSELKKKKALYTLAVVNLLTLPLNLPLIGGLIAYYKGNEIISNNWVLGTLRRVLTGEERNKLYQDTVNNFIDHIEASKEIKEQLQHWALENTQAMLAKYEAGSEFATEYVSDKLAMQKDVLQVEEIQKLYQNLLVNQTPKNEEGWFSWIYQNTGLHYLDPRVTDTGTCLKSWGMLIGTVMVTGFIIYLVAKSNAPSDGPINDLTKNLKELEVKVEILNMDTDAVLANALKAIEKHTDKLKTLTELATRNQKVNTYMHTEMIQVQNSFKAMIKKTQNILTPEKRNEIFTKVMKKYEQQAASMETIQQMLKEIITGIF